MKKKIWKAIPVTVFLVLLSACAKEKEHAGISLTFTQVSELTRTSYEVTVFYPDRQFPEHQVPVVLLLDGFWHYDAVSALLNEKSETGEIPKCLLISIGYTDGNHAASRMKDLVYPANEYVEEGVRGDLFYRFITEELFPKIESEYNTDTTKRTIMGHSLGGFFVLYSMLDHLSEPFFTRSVAASSHMGVGNHCLFTKEEEVAENSAALRHRLFMGCGNLAGDAPVLHDQFFRQIIARNYSGLEIELELYGASHNTDAYPTFANGLTYLFDHD